MTLDPCRAPALLRCPFPPVLTPLEPTGTSFTHWHAVLGLRLFLLLEHLLFSKGREVTYVITRLMPSPIGPRAACLDWGA